MKQPTLAALFSAIVFCAWLTTTFAQSAATQGDCSPALLYSEVKGSITINCSAHRKALEAIVAQFHDLRNAGKLNEDQLIGMVEAANTMLGTVLQRLGAISANARESLQGIRNIERLLIEQVIPKRADKSAQTIVAEAQDWKTRYESLLDLWRVVEGTSALDEEVRQALLQLDFGRAGRILDQLITKQEKVIEVAAARHFRRAEVFRLQFKRLDALPHYEKAHHFRPEDPGYAHAYAMALQEQQRFSDAERIYQGLLSRIRELARENPDQHRAALASTLTNLGALYGATQRLKEAERAYSEALDIYDRLPNYLSELGSHLAAAIDAACERVNDELRKKEAESGKASKSKIICGARTTMPGEHSMRAETLNSVGVLYLDQQRFRRARDVLVDALESRRWLAKENPIRFRPDVAVSLSNLGYLYTKTQRYEEANVLHVEALDIFRTLAKNNPAAYSRELAVALDRLGELYVEIRRFSEAEAVQREALAIQRKLTAEIPAARLDLARTLNNMGNLYGATQQYRQAEAAYTEAEDILRTLVRDSPVAFQHSLAATLNNLGRLYSETERYQQAEATYAEALQIYRMLAKDDPITSRPYLASTLYVLGLLHNSTLQFEKAEIALREAVETYSADLVDFLAAHKASHDDKDAARATLITVLEHLPKLAAMLDTLRTLAKNNPAGYSRLAVEVAGTLINMGNVYFDRQDYRQTEAAYTEAEDIFRTLARDNPVAFQHHLAETLRNLGILYGDRERYEQAEAKYAEALKLYRMLAKNDPITYRSHVASTLYLLGLLHNSTLQFENAEIAFREAVEMYIALRTPDNVLELLPNLAATLHALGFAHAARQQFKESEAVLNMALKLRRFLADANRRLFGDDLRKTLLALSDILQRTNREGDAKKLREEAQRYADQ